MEVNKSNLLEELKNNPKVQGYLANYESSSAQSFLDHYASVKELLLNYGEHYRNRATDDAIHYRSWAETYYWQIVQKKLFNLQCQWRAEKIDLPIEVTYEFCYWNMNIKACPFIEPVTDAEINAMITFLENAPYDHDDNYTIDWQDYDSFKDPEELMGAGDEYPNWYAWYDVHIGPSDVMSLPNVRGDYQQKCFAAWRAARNIEYIPALNRKPFLSTSQVEDFIRKVEPYKILDYYNLYTSWSSKKDKVEELNEQLEILFEEPGDVWIPQGKFPDAIFQAAYLLRVKKIKYLLPLIHQEHLERLEMGISYELHLDEFVETNRASFKEAKRLLEGER
jgi:hypothetical protein